VQVVQQKVKVLQPCAVLSHSGQGRALLKQRNRPVSYNEFGRDFKALMG
jgi:hypothetical protein